MKADLRHSELIIEQLGLKVGNGVTSPGVAEPVEEVDEHDQDLSAAEATSFRGMPARRNDLSSDRPDIMFAVKEIYRDMCRPTERPMMRLKRIGRYLKMHPRLVWKYCWQSPVNVFDIHTDSN